MRTVLRDSELLTGRALGQIFYRENKTEPYVEIPPALVITDADGSTWTFGTEYLEVRRHFEFNVVRNEVNTGEFAEKIVYQRGKVRIFGQYNGKPCWRVWTGKSFL